jgi:cutinase
MVCDQLLPIRRPALRVSLSCVLNMLHNLFSFAFLASLVVAAPLSSPASGSATNPPLEKAVELWKTLPKTPTTPPLSKVIKLLQEVDKPFEKRQTTNPGAYVFQELVEKKCAAVTIIFARGTNSDGNVGTLGPYVFNETAKLLGANNIVRQGVDYSATIIGYLQGGAPDGGPEMARLTRLARTQCPNTQVNRSEQDFVVSRFNVLPRWF